ncbi:energy transducer TonB [Flavobacterium sp.]|uniref:energy transducer TonB n=1 Tax=Flavobacterium sp. TaxID=239 RepID=UPI002B4B8FD7|nr:energy transducer TonB [Flavobacterium sp.]HLP65519.1 energy transducer TonB [Flavobacterium sp.]
MKKVIFAFLVIVSFSSFAQIGGEDEVYLNGERIDPTFNGGGLDKFYNYINKEFDFSKPTKEGAMITSFTISETGEIKNIKVVQFVDIESATEMIRVLKKAPKWKPATRNGKEISVDMKFPFNLVKKKPQTNSDTIKKENNDSNDNSLYSTKSVEVKPEYPGGIEEFYKYIMKNFKQPNDKNFKGGKIFVMFVIDRDGSLTDIKVKDIGFGTKEEAIRLMKKCKKWTPAMQKGIPVRCSYTIPITLQGN